MISVVIVWIAYGFLFVRFLFHGFRIGSFFATLLIVGVLFILLFLWTVHKITQPTSKRTRQAAGSSSPASGSAASTGSITFRVAGTTFDNDDGSSRQDILRHLKFGDEPWADDPDDLLATIEEETFNGELAFSVLVNGYQVGFVPKGYIQKVAKARQNVSSCYVSSVKITGGGTAEDGRKLSYGCTITLEY